jgi:hypothetical protein
MNSKLICSCVSAVLLSGLSYSSFAADAGISVAVNASSQTQCVANVSGKISSTPKMPATAVTIDFIPASGSSVNLVTNMKLGDGGAFQWNGLIPGYAKIPAGSQVKATTNRQVSAMAAIPACP